MNLWIIDYYRCLVAAVGLDMVSIKLGSCSGRQVLEGLAILAGL